MISVIAKIPVKEEKRDEAIEAFKQLITEVAKEEGTLFYSLNVSKQAPNTLVVMERYKDKEALKTHSSTPHFQGFFCQGWRAVRRFPGNHHPERTGFDLNRRGLVRALACRFCVEPRLNLVQMHLAMNTAI